MASASTLSKKCHSNGRTALLGNDARKVTEIVGGGEGEASLGRDMEALSVSKRLVRTVSERLKKKRNGYGGYSGEEAANSSPVPSRCISLHVKGGSCRVGACEESDLNGRRRSSSAMEDCMPQRLAPGVEYVEVECFSYGMTEKFCWKKNPRKGKETEQRPPCSDARFWLPDDVLEMILVRLPLASLMASRCVCKKWRQLTTMSHFLQMRSEGPHGSPWLFLFGITRNRHHAGEIHALDVAADRWHRFSSDTLKGRFLFSVAGVGSDIFVVGGCSISASSAVPTERSSSKKHKGVLVFSPLSGSWRKAAPMRSARSEPVLGVFEVGANCSVFRSQADRQEQVPLKSRAGGASEVYENPHRLTVRRKLRDAFMEDDNSSEPIRRFSKFVQQGVDRRSRYALIAVGGHGSWNEPLDSGEAYDPVTDRWVEIARLPGGFGTVCTGAVCGPMFYVYSVADRLAGYDLEGGFWVTFQASLPPPRLREYCPKLVSCRNRLFMFCVLWCERDGQLSRRDRAARKLCELDFALHTWNEVARHPDAPLDWNAAFVADGDRIYGVEMFRIFCQVLDFSTACDVSDTELKWSRLSRKHATHEADASSCTTKSMVVLRL